MYRIDRRLNRDEWYAISTERLRLCVLKKSATKKITDYYVTNRAFHSKWAQTHDDSYFTVREQKEYAKADTEGFFNGSLIPFFIYEKNDNTKIIGRISLFNISRGGMMNAMVGYNLDENYCGKGYMTEAIKATVSFAFEELKLHRIEAYILEENSKSLNLISRAGFEEEGIVHSFMHINGKWRDHRSFYIISDNKCIE